jgi:hypothetical protein
MLTRGFQSRYIAQGKEHLKERPVELAGRTIVVILEWVRGGKGLVLEPGLKAGRGRD